MALHQRQRTGKGTYIDLSQGENFVPHLGDLFMDYALNRLWLALRATAILG
jgi:crotonobetainyl-CoA:carnitine CoA-transferase CaiB-like acyl-CoA transferase